MILGLFAIGSEVESVAFGTRARVMAHGDQRTFLKDLSDGSEFLADVVSEDFKRSIRSIDLIRLGNDLVDSIRKADSQFLRKQTIHMQDAIDNWEAAIRV